MTEIRQLSYEEAIAVYDSKVWMKWTPEEIVKFQLYIKRLCLPFDLFQTAVEVVFERPVFTHEFAYGDALREEYERKYQKPSNEDIMNMVYSQLKVIGDYYES
jgi:hypothetical protein